MWTKYGLILVCMLPLAVQAQDCTTDDNVYDVIDACEKQIQRDKQVIATESAKLKHLVQQHNRQYMQISVEKNGISRSNYGNALWKPIVHWKVFLHKWRKVQAMAW